MKTKCDICRGTGWIKGGGDWPEACRFCGGKGKLSDYALGKKIGESPSTLKRVAEVRAKAPTAERVLDSLLRQMEASKP